MLFGTRYTLCLDVFPKFPTNPQVNKDTVAIDTERDRYCPSRWIEDVYKLRNLFAERTQTESQTITATDADLQHSSLDWENLSDYRLSNIELLPIDHTMLENIANNSLHAWNKKDIFQAEHLGLGVVRLFKDSPGHINLNKIDSPSELVQIPGDETTVAIIAVPFYLTTSELLLGFFEGEVLNQLSHLRLIKMINSNRTMALLKFKDKKHVSPFMNSYNGRKFSSLDPETCAVIKIKEICFRPLDEKGEQVGNSLPYLLPDPFTSSTSTLLNDKNDTHSSIKKFNYTELPTCPVCLERLDSDVTGIVTIQCQHSYHCLCLSKWSEDKCPVCRYSTKSNIDRKKNISNDLLTNYPLSLHETYLALNSRKNSYQASVLAPNKKSHSLVDNPTELFNTSLKMCHSCNEKNNLWICLVCGNVGCGRYNNEHAVKHFFETNHCFSMDLNTQRVWDYERDGYVHRLVQNEADGKIVELTLQDESKKSLDKKIDNIGFEYSKMLISQLESQRDYYTSIIEQFQENANYHAESTQRLLEKCRNLESQVDSLAQNLDASNKKFECLGESHLTATKEQECLIKQIEKLKSSNEEKKDIQSRKIIVLQNKLQEESLINEGLLSNMDKMKILAEDNIRKNLYLKTQNLKLAKDLKDLQDTNTDLLAHFEMQAKLDSTSKGGDIYLNDNNSTLTPARQRELNNMQMISNGLDAIEVNDGNGDREKEKKKNKKKKANKKKG